MSICSVSLSWPQTTWTRRWWGPVHRKEPTWFAGRSKITCTVRPITRGSWCNQAWMKWVSPRWISKGKLYSVYNTRTFSYFWVFFILYFFAVQFPISLRLNRLFSENLSRPESKDAEQLRQEVADNVSWVLDVGGLMFWLSVITSLFFVAVERGVQADSWGSESATNVIQVTYFWSQKDAGTLKKIFF